MNEKRLNKTKEMELREEYLKNHPELPGLLAFIKLDVLRNKPDDISFYIANFIFSSHNRENLESALGMSLQS